MCDIILASPTATFGQPEIKLGVTPGMGGSQRLAHAVGKAKAMEMCLTGRMMGAEEAERAGLVARVVPAAALLGQLGTIPRLAELLGRLGVPEGEQSAEQAAAAVEFALEGLYLTRRLAKDTDGTRTVYGA